MANVQSKINLNVLKALALANNGTVKRTLARDCNGDPGFVLMIAWDDEDESDAFTELLEDILKSETLVAFNDGDEPPPKLLSASHDHEGGVLHSFHRFNTEIK